MHIRTIKIVLLLVWGLTLAPYTQAQQMVHIKGKVLDADTKEPLPFVNIAFVGANIGTISDYNGFYELNTKWGSKTLSASYLGYEPVTKQVNNDKFQTINFLLKSKNVSLGEVVVSEKRTRYRNKNNPAVDLIRLVLAHRKKNRLASYDYYEYNKYEKIEFDLNNFGDGFKNSRAMRNFQFMFQYVDTSDVNGKPYLPIFLQETLSKTYYRKHPKTSKEYVEAINTIGMEDYIDNEGLRFVLDNLYSDIDLYDNSIMLLTSEFVSPISPLAPNIYKFHIKDTSLVNGYDCIELLFQPRNKADLAFKGSLFITNDSTYSLKKVKMKVAEGINLNFVNDLQIEQEFERLDNGTWIKTKDELVIDYNMLQKAMGVFGKRSVHTSHYLFDVPQHDSIYNGINKKIIATDYDKQDTAYWQKNRTQRLSEQEANIYVMMDSVQNVPTFQRAMDIITLLTSGYWNVGKIDIGPVGSFYSWNSVEGYKLRFGGQTSDLFSKQTQLEGHVAYGFKDQRFKYAGGIKQSLNKQPIKAREHHYVSAKYERGSRFPGLSTIFINDDNFLLSVKRGKANKIIYFDQATISHHKYWGNGLSTIFSAIYNEQAPGGSLSFRYTNGSILHKLISSELKATFLFAPNAIIYQGSKYQTHIINKFPIFQLSIAQGFKNVMRSHFQYTKLKLSIFKRFYLSTLGYTNVEVEGAKIFGQVPYPLMFLHRANQTYSYQLRSYNLMNFLEFVSDEYVSLFAEHHFNGFIFNKIPLVRYLKWRGIVSFKAVYGNVTNSNNPALTKELMLFPTDDNGNTDTYVLRSAPYMEASIGVGNIFKFLRIDLVRRLSYLDHPNVSEYGIRARIKIEF